MSEFAIKMENVGVSYRMKRSFFSSEDYWALRHFSMELQQGETVGVIGKNGAGKSTLLRLMSGLIDPDGGQIYFAGLRASLLTLNLGFMAQLSGRENAIMGGLYAGMKKSEILANMDSIEEMADIGQFFDQPIFSYSAGMKARLGFSVAIHTSPDILLIDETIGVGDYEFKQKSAKILKEKIRSNLTVVLVSHQISQITELCDRVIWLENGCLCKSGPTKEVVEAYNAKYQIA